LALNSLFVWIFLQFGVAAPIAKAIAIPPVLIWNFLARRTLVFHQELPDTTFALSNRVAQSISGETASVEEMPAKTSQSPK
jgi:putative flippase GtrA